MSAKPPVATLESLDELGRGLRVEFLQLADRYAHRILFVDPQAGERVLFTSVENSSEDQPQAAVFQAVNLQALRDAATAAAMIGMAGPNHWSLAIEPNRPPGPPRLIFDAACRIKKPARRLAIRYELAEGVWSINNSSTPIIACGIVKIRLTPLAVDVHAPLAEARIDANQLAILYAPTFDQPLPATHRWRVALDLLP